MAENVVDDRSTRTCDDYVRFWNSGVETARAASPGLFDPQVRYLAPLGQLVGPEALIGFRTQFAEHIGEFEFGIRDEVQCHNDRIRLRWEIRLPDRVFASGTDLLTLGADGLVEEVVAFLDRAPDGGVPAPHHDERTVA